MTPKERILSAIRGQMPDQIPFTIYDGMVPSGEAERSLRNQGMGIIRPWHPVYKVHNPNIVIERKEYWEGKEQKTRETVKTPVGEIWRTFVIAKEAYGSTWTKDFYIKNPEDYKVMEFMINDAVYQPDYQSFLERERQLGEDGILTGGIDRSPIQKMLVELMGVERFSFDLFNESKRFYSLYNAILEKQRESWEIAANSPAEIVHFPDNITDILGPERFKHYCLPCYNELGQLLHKKGKRLAVHMDGMLSSLKKAIAQTEVDIIEAFTPPPMGDLSLKEARSLWEDKVIWINFTSSIHLSPPEEVRAHTINLLREVVPGDRFLIGNTEDIPQNVINKSLSTILQVLQEKGNLPLHFD